jgi:NAD(P)-dependent dehydrogenase (short-subunit alcohol dehydrogenase family)
MKLLEGKTALITGAASGIGEATSRLFIKEGAKVLLTDIHDERGESLSQKLGADTHFLHVDVSEESQIEKAVQYCVDNWETLDIIFNNAGMGGVSAPFDELPIDGIESTVDVLLKGVILGVKHSSRVMKKQGFGSIINNASGAGIIAGPSPSVYSACKAAVMHLTKVSAHELGEFGIRVNAVCPGVILTRIWNRGQDYADEQYKALEAVFKDAQPLRRCGMPEDIAKAVLWLASDDAGFVSGHSLVVDGGATTGLTRDSINRFRKEIGEALQR